MSTENVEVVIRARALIQKGMDADRHVLWNIMGNAIEPGDASVPNSQNLMVFDHVFGVDSTNKELHEAVVAPLVTSCLEGYNCTVFSYGSTSSGKQQTMEGSSDDTGIIPRVIQQLFRTAGRERKNSRYLIRMAYFKIYNDRVYDLLKFQNHDVRIVEDIEGRTMICAREVVTSIKDQVFDLLKLGNRNRQMYSRKMKIKDSQTDTILRIIIEHEVPNGAISPIQIAHLNLVTLAGSERVACSEGLLKFVDREYINRSSSILASIIARKVKEEPVNYRQSKLTALLKNSIGGNAKVVFIADISLASLETTYFTLDFALQVRCLRNKPTINVIRTTNCILRQCLREIKHLEEQLQDVKKRCPDLGIPVQRMQPMQTADVVQERIKLISKAFVRSTDMAEQEFPNLLTRSSQLNLSPLETRLLNVVRANSAYRVDSIGKRIKLPFELLLVRLSIEIGNEFIAYFHEEDQEELLVTDYLLLSDAHSCKSNLKFSKKSEYSEMERSILTQITNEELRTDLNNLSAIFTANYAQQLTSFKATEQQNQILRNEIAELTKKLNLQNKETENLQMKIGELELEQKIRKQVSEDYKKQCEQLLKQVDEKNIEYLTLSIKNNDLKEKVNALRVALDKTRPTPQQFDVSEPDIFTLQSEIFSLKQELMNQEFIINLMDVKHKRREDELLGQLDNEGIQRERIFSDIMKTDKHMQTSPQLSETQEQSPTSIASEDSSASSWVQCPETLGNLPEEMLALTKTEDQKDMEAEILQLSRVELEQFQVMAARIFRLLSDGPVDDIEDLYIFTRILHSAKQVFDTCQDKCQLLDHIQGNDLYTDNAIQYTAYILTEIIRSEIEDVRTFIDEAHKPSFAVCVLLKEIQAFRAYKRQEYVDILGDLAEQISALRKQLIQLENQLEAENRHAKKVQKDSAAKLQKKLPKSGEHSESESESEYLLLSMTGASTSASFDVLINEKELDWIRQRVEELTTRYEDTKVLAKGLT